MLMAYISDVNVGKKNNGVGFIILLMIVVAIAAGAYLIIPGMLNPTIKLQLGDGLFKAKVVRTSGQLNEQVVSDHTESVLGAMKSDNPIKDALLYVFPSDGKWKVPLSNFSEAIDAVWLNNEKKVIYIIKDATADSLGVDSIMPRSDARYVVQLAAGTVDEKSIQIGSPSMFDEGER